MKKKFVMFLLVFIVLMFLPKNITYADNSDTVYNGVDYSAVYNKDYYLSQHSDLQSKIGNNPVALLSHFVNFGMNEGRQANTIFDLNYYKSTYGDLKAAYGNNLKLYYYHFIQFGYNEGRRTNAANIDYTAIYGGIDYSAIYNKDYYLNRYPDLKTAYGNNTTQLIVHFINFGMAEGRQGCGTFNIASYIANYPDLRAAYLTNIKSYYTHYLQFGNAEGRAASGTETYIDFSAIYNGKDYSAVYNKDYYLNKYSDLRAAYGNNSTALIVHFLNFGMAEGRQACSTFNVAAYYLNYSDLRGIFKLNLKSYYFHFMNYGLYEGRIANGDGVWKTVGIDISDHNGVINWEAVKNSGIGFAIIKIGCGDNSVLQDDKQAIANMNECERLGIPYGVYLYSYALRLEGDESIDSEVQHTLRMLKGRNPAMGVYIDMEDTDGYKSRNGLNPYTNGELLTQMCIRYMNSIKANGYSVGTYANKDYFTRVLNYDSIKANGEVWYAQWGVENPSYSCFIWQYSSSGIINGINGYVDLDILIGK